MMRSRCGLSSADSVASNWSPAVGTCALLVMCQYYLTHVRKSSGIAPRLCPYFRRDSDAQRDPTSAPFPGRCPGVPVLKRTFSAGMTHAYLSCTKALLDER